MSPVTVGRLVGPILLAATDCDAEELDKLYHNLCNEITLSELLQFFNIIGFDPDKHAAADPSTYLGRLTSIYECIQDEHTAYYGTYSNEPAS